ncbi:class I SAM-dependent RNA methyltransferase [Acidipropionibacterium jensenii]|uniref:class I SAM-dependent RNA methyltransferase n=1 Tax=Acidipropionibacterium jensenii TaxID=1749 RepID=UPI00214C4112|nr:methyltransferase [Acidipropionibacterium jensenii]
MTQQQLTGPILELDLGPVAHGGFCVARSEGRVVFVRGGLPGERVRARVIDDSKASHWFATTTQVLRADPHRIDPVCPVAGECGGCDFQHVEIGFQRELKRRVVAEQLDRIAGIDWTGVVEPAREAEDGLGWRTRMHYRTTDGAPALRAFRSHELVPVPAQGCPISHPAGRQAARRVAAEGPEDLQVTVSGTGAGTPQVSVLADGKVVEGQATVTETVDRLSLQVDAGGFWQVHPQAAQRLGEAVIDGLQPGPGDRALDLYCGVGLFAALMAQAGARVEGVEVSRRAVQLARRNVEGRFVVGRTERAARQLPRHADLVVLDPPRKGAGRRVVGEVVARRPRAVAHVACDPAALARDLSLFAEGGYHPVSIRALDLFPMTHHVECVAILAP